MASKSTEKQKDHSLPAATQWYRQADIRCYLSVSSDQYFYLYGTWKIQFYEVSEGGIVNDRPYTGLILREEQVYNADNSGYINYYLRKANVLRRFQGLFSDETGRLIPF